MARLSEDVLRNTTDILMKKLCEERELGILSTALLPEEYLRRFREIATETAMYKTDAEEQIEMLSEAVVAATSEVAQSLDAMTEIIHTSTEDLKAIDEAQKCLQNLNTFKNESTEETSTTFDKIEVAVMSLTERLLQNQNEVSQSKKRITELETELSTDMLTKAGNRVAMEKRLLELEKNKTPYAVIGCDLNFFKVVNDTFGHAAGDEVLKIFVGRTQGSLKNNDAVYRTGGDEFIVLLENVEDAATMKKIIGRVRNAVSGNPIVMGEHEVPLSVSMGGAICDWKNITSKSAAFHLADKNIYKDKESIEREQAGLELERIAAEVTNKDVKAMFRKK